VNPSHPETPQRTTVEGPLQISGKALTAICSELKRLLADVFAMYIKTKNFHWHMMGPHFRDYHLLLNEQAGQLFAMTDPIAERSRKLGGDALRSIGDIALHQRVEIAIRKGWLPKPCSQSFWRITECWPTISEPHRSSATSSATLPLQAWSKTGSMKPTDVPGS
jgi:hypothetical protein